jgi:hypothetical protein
MATIQTRYLGPTTFKGSRVVADDGDGNRIILPWRCHLNSEDNHKAAAIALCEKLGWGGTLQGSDIVRGGVCIGKVWVWLDKTCRIRVKPLPAFTHPV